MSNYETFIVGLVADLSTNKPPKTMMISSELSHFEKDVNQLQHKVYHLRHTILPKLTQLYTQGMVDIIKTTELFNKSNEMKRRVMELRRVVSEFQLELGQIRQQPQKHGPGRAQLKQLNAGKVGSINDTLNRLKIGLDRLLQDMNKLKFGDDEKRTKERQLKAIELQNSVELNVPDYQQWQESWDAFGLVLAFTVIIIEKYFKKK